MNKPTFADDCERLVRILESGPVDGMSLEEIQDVMEHDSEVWSYHTINKILCALGNQVQFSKIRVSRRKVTKYRLQRGE
jgi:hypothetical protein